MADPKNKSSKKKTSTKKSKWKKKAEKVKEKAINLGKAILARPHSFLKNRKEQVDKMLGVKKPTDIKEKNNINDGEDIKISSESENTNKDLEQDSTTK